MIDVAEAIDAEAGTVAYRPVAAAGGAYNTGGAWVPVAPVPTTIAATIQPASGAALRDLPEGIRDEADYLGWSRTAVLLDDEIQFVGRWYRVMYVWPRVTDGFTRFALGRLKP